MRKPQGYAVWSGPGNKTTESDTFTCSHCNSVVFVSAQTSVDAVGGGCRLCSKFICSECVDKGVCTPFEQKLEAMERRERLLKAASSG